MPNDAWRWMMFIMKTLLRWFLAGWMLSTGASRGEAEPAPADFTFAVVGDVQGKGASGAWREAATWLASRQPAFWVAVGDLVDMGQDRAQWDAFLADGKSLMEQSPIRAVVGNHDLYRDGKPEGKKFISEYPSILFDLFPQPAPMADEPFDGWYSFTNSNALVIVLNAYAYPPPGHALASDPRAYEEQSRARQMVWAREQLAQSKATHTFLVLHPPVYSSGAHGVAGDQPYERAVSELADEFKVAAVFSGHVHAFEVSKPLRAGAVVEGGAGGTIYYNTAGINFSDVAAGSWFTDARQEKAREPLVALVRIHGDAFALETWNWRTGQLVHQVTRSAQR